MAVFDKTRAEVNKVEKIQLLQGEVRCKVCVVIDDIIDTGGTLFKIAEKAKEMGAVEIYAFATHGLFSGEFFNNLKDSCIEKIFVTDSLPQKESEKGNMKIERISIKDLVVREMEKICE